MAGRIAKPFIEKLLARVDIVDVIGQAVTLKKAGRDFQGLCPFHNEKTPSFTVSPEKQFYHCFGCGVHGSSIGFLMNHGGLSFSDAVQDLASRSGLEIEYEGGIEALARILHPSMRCSLMPSDSTRASCANIRRARAPSII